MPKNFAGKKKSINFAAQLREQGFQPSLRIALDSLAQLVEHNTFNVGVVGSNPTRITKNKTRLKQLDQKSGCFFFLYTSEYSTVSHHKGDKIWERHGWDGGPGKVGWWEGDCEG